MKNKIGLVLLCLGAFTLAGCVGETQEVATPTASPAKPAAAPPPDATPQTLQPNVGKPPK